MKKLFISMFSFLCFAQMIFAQQKWAIYQNARYGYEVSYPPDLFEPQGEADNGDGQIFSNDAAEMRVFGSQMLLHKTLRGEFDALVKERENVSYKIFRRSYFVISGTESERIFYQKTAARNDETFVTFYIEYDESQRGIYDKITARIVGSFK